MGLKHLETVVCLDSLTLFSCPRRGQGHSSLKVRSGKGPPDVFRGHLEAGVASISSLCSLGSQLLKILNQFALISLPPGAIPPVSCASGPDRLHGAGPLGARLPSPSFHHSSANSKTNPPEPHTQKICGQYSKNILSKIAKNCTLVQCDPTWPCHPTTVTKETPTVKEKRNTVKKRHGQKRTRAVRKTCYPRSLMVRAVTLECFPRASGSLALDLFLTCHMPFWAPSFISARSQALVPGLHVLVRSVCFTSLTRSRPLEG